jgi:hypothetical protein
MVALSDNDADGTVDSRSAFTYDANNNRIRSESDSDADGIPESINSFENEPSGWAFVFDL